MGIIELGDISITRTKREGRKVIANVKTAISTNN
jgi:hypothetical protein